MARSQPCQVDRSCVNTASLHSIKTLRSFQELNSLPGCITGAFLVLHCEQPKAIGFESILVMVAIIRIRCTFTVSTQVKWMAFPAVDLVGLWSQEATSHMSLMQNRLACISIIAMSFLSHVISQRGSMARSSLIQRKGARLWIVKW